MSAPATKGPVTTAGWYERTDGTVGYYRWAAGELCCDSVVASWSDVTRAQSAEDDAILSAMRGAP